MSHSDGGFLVCSVVPTVQNSRPAQFSAAQGQARAGRCCPTSMRRCSLLRPEHVCAVLVIKVYIKVWQFARPSIPVSRWLLP